MMNLFSLSLEIIIFCSSQVLCLNHNHIECIVPKAKTQPSLQGGRKFGTNYPSKNDYFAENCAPVLENLEVLHLGYVWIHLQL